MAPRPILRPACAEAARLRLGRPVPRAYQVRDPSPSEAAGWLASGTERLPFARTIVRASDGATVTCGCYAPDEFGSWTDRALAATFDADLDAAATARNET